MVAVVTEAAGLPDAAGLILAAMVDGVRDLMCMVVRGSVLELGGAVGSGERGGGGRVMAFSTF